jgi:hypothetical protein
MNEKRIFEQLVASEIGMHPLIQECSEEFEEKLKMQMLLEVEFNGDIKAMVSDMIIFYIELEEYETAAIIRDEFLNKL